MIEKVNYKTVILCNQNSSTSPSENFKSAGRNFILQEEETKKIRRKCSQVIICKIMLTCPTPAMMNCPDLAKAREFTKPDCHTQKVLLSNKFDLWVFARKIWKNRNAYMNT